MKSYYLERYISSFAVKCALLLTIFGHEAFAQSLEPNTPISGLFACHEMKDNNDRLACYDSAVARLKIKEKDNEILILDSNEIKAAKKAAFGFSMPKLKLFDNNNEKENSTEIKVEVIKLGKSGNRPSIVTNEGQVWVVLDDEEFDPNIKLPRNAYIRSASFSSFLLNFEGRNKSYRVKRVQ